MNWYVWAIITFNLLELGVICVACAIVQRHRRTHPAASRLLSRAIAFWAVALVIGVVAPYMSHAINIEVADRVDWTALVLDVGQWRFLLLQLVISALYAWSIWLMAQAALTQPDRQAPMPV